MFISTMITTDITLGQLADIDPGVPRSSEEDMVKFLQFRATASLGNNEVFVFLAIYSLLLIELSVFTHLKILKILKFSVKININSNVSGVI